MSGFTYRLYLENGEDIGNFATAVPTWSIGDEFFDRDHNLFRIVNIVPELDDGEFQGMFVVTLVEPRNRERGPRGRQLMLLRALSRQHRRRKPRLSPSRRTLPLRAAAALGTARSVHSPGVRVRR